jgi:hypothetical protein
MSLTTNLWKRLKQLLPESPLLVGTVDSVSAYGAMVLLPDGSLVSVRGESTVGAKVFVRAGKIEGPAPALTVVEIEI